MNLLQGRGWIKFELKKFLENLNNYDPEFSLSEKMDREKMHDKHVKQLDRLEREQKLRDEEIRMKDELLRKTQSELEEIKNQKFF